MRAAVTPVVPQSSFYMHVGMFKGVIPASFEATGFENGKVVTGSINLMLNRTSYEKITEKTFKAAMEKVQAGDSEMLGNILAGYKDDDGVTHTGLLGDWDLWEDDKRTKKVPITCRDIITLDPYFVKLLAACVFETLFLDPATAGNSPAGSAPEGNINSAATQDIPATPLALVEDTSSQEPVGSGV